MYTIFSLIPLRFFFYMWIDAWLGILVLEQGWAPHCALNHCRLKCICTHIGKLNTHFTPLKKNKWTLLYFCFNLYSYNLADTGWALGAMISYNLDHLLLLLLGLDLHWLQPQISLMLLLFALWYFFWIPLRDIESLRMQSSSYGYVRM